MKCIFVALILVSFNLFAARTPSPQVCKVINSWLSGYDAEKICSENGGSFCSTVKNKGQGICYGAKASFCSNVMNTGEGICYALGGNFCSTVKQRSQGICYGLDESFCSNLKQDDDATWTKKLAKACAIEMRNLDD